MAIGRAARAFVALLAFAYALAHAQQEAPAASTSEAVAVPADLAEALAPYDEFRRHRILAWNPWRREMLVQPRQGDNRSVHAVREPGAAPVALTAATVEGAWFPRGSHEYFLYTSAEGGEAPRLFRQDTAGGATALSAPGVQVNSVAIAPRGDRIAYATIAAGKDGKDATAVHVMNALRPKSDRVVARLAGRGWSAFRFSADGCRLAFVETLSAHDARLWVMDAASGQRRRVSPLPKDGTVAYGSPAFTRDGRALLATSDRDSPFRRLALLPLDGKPERALTARIAHDVESFDVAYDANRIAFSTNEDGASVLRFLDAASLRELPRPPLLQGVIGALQWRPGSDEVAFEVSAAKTAGDVFSYEVAANKLTRWTNGNSRRLNMSQLPEPRPIEWKGRDGRRVTALLYAPPAAFGGKRPVVVRTHAAGEQARPGFIGRNNYLVNGLGIALVFPNPGGSAGFGKMFLAREGEAASDLEALRDWIAAQPDLDAGRVAFADVEENVEALAPTLRTLLAAGASARSP